MLEEENILQLFNLILKRFLASSDKVNFREKVAEDVKYFLLFKESFDDFIFSGEC